MSCRRPKSPNANRQCGGEEGGAGASEAKEDTHKESAEEEFNVNSKKENEVANLNGKRRKRENERQREREGNKN